MLSFLGNSTKSHSLSIPHKAETWPYGMKMFIFVCVWDVAMICSCCCSVLHHLSEVFWVYVKCGILEKLKNEAKHLILPEKKH